MKNIPKIVFFGTPDFSAKILEKMKENELSPCMIVTAPDKKVGRKQILTPSAVALFAKENNIMLMQPNNPEEILQELRNANPDMFVVAAYGYIVSQNILDIPKHGTLNVHTSLLPLYRGACPIESALLNGDKETGSTIMLMDYMMDHGPIISQEKIEIKSGTNRQELFEILADHGGNLLVDTIPKWLNKEITSKEQDHSMASFCYKIKKSDGEITNDDDIMRYRKYLAYYNWPGIYYINEQGKRIKVVKGRYENQKFIIQRIIEEGKNEKDY